MRCYAELVCVLSKEVGDGMAKLYKHSSKSKEQHMMDSFQSWDSSTVQQLMT